jgi:hypothetical protein
MYVLVPKPTARPKANIKTFFGCKMEYQSWLSPLPDQELNQEIKK